MAPPHNEATLDWLKVTDSESVLRQVHLLCGGSGGGDSDATLRAFLSRRQVDALQSEHTEAAGDISQGTAAGL